MVVLRGGVFYYERSTPVEFHSGSTPSFHCFCVCERERVSVFHFRVSGLGFRVSDLGFRVLGFEFQISGFEFWIRVSSFGLRVSGIRFWVSVFIVSDSGSWVSGVGLRDTDDARALLSPLFRALLQAWDLWLRDSYLLFGFEGLSLWFGV